VLKRREKRIVYESFNSEVIVELPDGTEITSIITKSSAENPDLKEGHEIYAVIKASSVMLASD
jgi:molybdopterin-binding protein